MGALTNKVRLYDLAKELKIDTKRLIEEVRREGVDVSVPSNSVSKELAEKIRDKYLPKKDTAVKRAVRVVKKAARPVVEETPETVETAPEETPETIEVSEPEPPEIEAAPEAPQTTAHVVRKLSPAVRAAKPAPAAIAETVPEQDSSPSEPAEAIAPAPVSVETVAPTGRQVRVLRPTAAALNAGIRPGERAPAPTPPPTIPQKDRSAERSGRLRERPSLPRSERIGTPGETATPQTTYIPPPDSGRRRSRRSSP